MSDLASNGVMVIFIGIGYFIYKKCNSKCHYDSKKGFNIDIGGGSDTEDEDKDLPW